MPSFTVIDLTIVVLAFFATMALGGAVIMFLRGPRDVIRKRLNTGPGGETSALFNDRQQEGRLYRVFEQVGGASGGKEASSTLRKKMVQAGYSGEAAVQVFLGVKMIFLCLCLLLSLLIVLPMQWNLMHKTVAILLGVGIPFFLPNLFLEFKRKQRMKEVQRNLPTMVDLLEICVSGGMGMDMAWNAVAEQTRTVSRTLADEMALTDLEVHLGEDRGTAIRHMAERTGSEELSSLVAVLVQSERFGTSISDALASFAQSMRELRSLKAEEAAEQMAVKMLFPMVVFIFPVEIIIAVGPAGIEIARILGE